MTVVNIEDFRNQPAIHLIFCMTILVNHLDMKP